MSDLQAAGLALLALATCVICMVALMDYAIRENIGFPLGRAYDFSGSASCEIRAEAYACFLRWVGKGAFWAGLSLLVSLPMVMLL